MKLIAIDSGKYGNKIAAYVEEESTYIVDMFRTKMSEANIEDDIVEKGTTLVEYEGKAYKLGYAGKKEAESVTSKKSEIHKIATLTSIAKYVTEENETVNVAIGIPLNEHSVYETREDYKNYILPEGMQTFLIKEDGEKPPVKKTFTINNRYVFPESVGALYLNYEKLSEFVGIIDLGSLNLNASCWNNGQLDEQYTVTAELGGNLMIEGLAQELSAEFGRCDSNLVARILKNYSGDERCLHPVNGNKEIEVKSKEIINKYLLDYVRNIKRCCDQKKWPLNYMSLVFIGGTTELVKNEIYEVFGENVLIAENPELVNVIGFLRRLAAKYNIDILKEPEISEFK